MWKNFVNNILNSATKLVLLTMTIALCVLTRFGIVDWWEFIIICSMVFSFYFKGTTTTADKDLNPTIVNVPNTKERSDDEA